MRELSMGEKQVISKLRKEGKSVRAIGQTLGIASNTIRNVLREERNHWCTEQQMLDRLAKGRQQRLIL